MTKLGPLALSLVLSILAAFPAAGFGDEGAPTGPVLSFSPAPVSFAKTTAGAESTTEAVDVYNAGEAAVSVDKVTVEGGDSGDFKLTGSNCGWLDPGQHCTAWVVFAPGSPGAKSTTLGLQLKEAPEQTVPLSGEAVPVQLSFSPGSYDFGIRRTNDSASTGFQLTNGGEAAAQVGSVGTGGRDSGSFWIGNNDCWGGRWLQPGESCNLQVYFNPWDATPYEAELQAYAYGVSFTADLAGTGGRPQLEPDSNPVDFGQVTVGKSGPVQTIVLTNEGNLAGGYFIAVIAGGSVGSFELIDETCTGDAIAPGGTCVVRVRFKPQDLGEKVARLALFGDSDGGTMVMLAGEGVSGSTAGQPQSAAGAAASAANVAKPPVPSRGKRRRFGRGAALFAGQARCPAAKPCRRTRGLLGRTAVNGG